jgi:hypothetical protein
MIGHANGCGRYSYVLLPLTPAAQQHPDSVALPPTPTEPPPPAATARRPPPFHATRGFSLERDCPLAACVGLQHNASIYSKRRASSSDHHLTSLCKRPREPALAPLISLGGASAVRRDDRCVLYSITGSLVVSRSALHHSALWGINSIQTSRASPAGRVQILYASPSSGASAAAHRDQLAGLTRRGGDSPGAAAPLVLLHASPLALPLAQTPPTAQDQAPHTRHHGRPAVGPDEPGAVPRDATEGGRLRPRFRRPWCALWFHAFLGHTSHALLL